MPADFTPKQNSYTELKNFRFWCQKVLPLVYDDSLSYYELLCKVVDYLNKAMEDIMLMGEDITNLHKAYVLLQDYVNNYFTNLDVQEEINNKLDEMVKDGTFATVIMPIVVQYSTPHFVDSKAEMTNPNYIYVLNGTGNVWAWNGTEFIDTTIPYLGGVFEFMRNYGTLPNNSDLNSIITNSFYVLSDSNDYLNMPPIPSGNAAVLETVFSNSQTSIQNFYLWSNGNRWFRRKSLGTWSEWIKSTYEDPENSLIQKTITSDDATKVYSNKLSNLPVNSYSWVSNTWFNDCPADVTTSFWVYTYSQGGNRNPVDTYGTQIIVNPYSVKMYSRYYNLTLNGWENWEGVTYTDPNTSFDFLMGVSQQTAETVYNKSLTNLPRNSYVWISRTWFEDTPPQLNNGSFFWVETYGAGGNRLKPTNYGTQRAFSPSMNIGVTRRILNYDSATDTATWSEWEQETYVDPNLALQFLNGLNETTAASLYNNLAENLPRNTYAWCFKSWFTDVPQTFPSNSCWLVTLGAGGNRNKLSAYGTQMLLSPHNGLTGFIRTITGGTSTDPTYSEWSPLNGMPYQTMPKYVAFGDSLMWGSMWIEQEGGTAKIVRCAVNDQMPTRIAQAIGSMYNFQNQAVGGMAYINGPGVTTPTMEEKIKSVDLSGTRIVTLGGGRNDSANPLGTSASLANDGTICGAIKSILDYLTTTFPFMQIVFTQVTPSTNNPDDIFTKKTTGGWSLDDYANEVSALCALYGIPFVDWKECTYIRHWVQFTGAGGNYAHPNNAESYIQMGNYLAGKVSSYYKG